LIDNTLSTAIAKINGLSIYYQQKVTTKTAESDDLATITKDGNSYEIHLPRHKGK